MISLKSNKKELLVEIARLKDYELSLESVYSYTDEILSIVCLIRDSDELKNAFHAKNALNGILTILFNIQSEIED